MIDIKDHGLQVSVNGDADLPFAVSAGGRPNRLEMPVEPGDYKFTIVVPHGPQLSTKESFSIKKGQKRNVEVSIVHKEIVAKLDNQSVPLAQINRRAERKQRQ